MPPKPRPREAEQGAAEGAVAGGIATGAAQIIRHQPTPAARLRVEIAGAGCAWQLSGADLRAADGAGRRRRTAGLRGRLSPSPGADVRHKSRLFLSISQIRRNRRLSTRLILRRSSERSAAPSGVGECAQGAGTPSCAIAQIRQFRPIVAASTHQAAHCNSKPGTRRAWCRRQPVGRTRAVAARCNCRRSGRRTSPGRGWPAASSSSRAESAGRSSAPRSAGVQRAAHRAVGPWRAAVHSTAFARLQPSAGAPGVRAGRDGWRAPQARRPC